jgi:DNA repair exonuclease SbcCD ATPase subunit
MRLHSVIFSLNAQVPFVAVEYDPKVGGLASLSGFERFNVPLGEMDAALLAERMREALAGREGFREAASAMHQDLRTRARDNAAVAAKLLAQPQDRTSYDAATSAVIARMVTARVADTDDIWERLEECCRELGQPTTWLRPVEMADRVLMAAKELREERRHLAENRTESERLRLEVQELAVARQRLQRDSLQLIEELREAGAAAAAVPRLERENQSLTEELEQARHAAGERFALEKRVAELGRQLEETQRAAAGAQQRLETDLARTASTYQARLAPLLAKTPGAIVKRALHICLDVLQMITPGPLRAAVRKHYLNRFYFRIYPERRDPSGSVRFPENPS